MDGSQAAETALITLVGCMFGVYFLQYFILGRIRRFGPWVNLWYVGNESRQVWASIMMEDPKEGINAVQSLRNGMLSASLLATVCSQLGSRIIAQLGSPEALQSFRDLSESDPITGAHSIASPQLKLCLALGTLLMSLLCMMQHVRLTMHLMFIMRTVSGDPVRHQHWRELVDIIFRRSSRTFALGLRMLALFVPAILWTVGITACFIGSVIEIIFLFSMDLVPASAARLLEQPPKGALALDLTDAPSDSPPAGAAAKVARGTDGVAAAGEAAEGKGTSAPASCVGARAVAPNSAAAAVATQSLELRRRHARDEDEEDAATAFGAAIGAAG